MNENCFPSSQPHVSCQGEEELDLVIIIIIIIVVVVIIIIINPLTARIFGAPQMILRPVSSIFFFFLHCPLGLSELQAYPFSNDSHLFFCLPCLLPAFAVPCKMVLARPDEREI